MERGNGRNEQEKLPFAWSSNALRLHARVS
jgi:hypothetical protein